MLKLATQLPDLAPALPRAMCIARCRGYSILGGTLAPIDRQYGVRDRLCAGDRHHQHGVDTLMDRASPLSAGQAV